MFLHWGEVESSERSGVRPAPWNDYDAIEEIKARVKRERSSACDVEHSTLEVEITGRQNHHKNTLAPE